VTPRAAYVSAPLGEGGLGAVPGFRGFQKIWLIKHDPIPSEKSTSKKISRILFIPQC